MTDRQPRYGDIFAGHDDGASMAEYARVLWAEYKADLKGRNLWNPARSRTLDRLVRAIVEHDHLSPIVIQEGAVKVGPNGGDVFNFNWSALQKLNDQIMKLEKALTLTPESIGEKVGSPKGKTDPTKASKYLERSAAH